ncbi:MAG: hypothetical protein JJV98_04795 [Desulfosarcina sp.]|nr:hypothetical protein [Desulfobacterales bacterium]
MPEFLQCGKVLSMIGPADNAFSRKAYRRFVQKGIGAPSVFNLKEEVSAQTVLGSDGFRDWLRDRFLTGRTQEDPELPAAKSLSVIYRSPGEIAALLAPTLAVTVESLLQPRSSCRDERAIFLELCRVHLVRGRSLSTVAAALGIRVSALSQNHKRLRTLTASLILD